MLLTTLDNSLKTLDYFTKENPEWGVRELAKVVGKSPSMIYRTLATFEKHGFLKKSLKTDKYRLDLKVLEYGLIVQDELKIPEIIAPDMNRLRDTTNESIYLTWLDKLEGVCISIIESKQNIQCKVSLGSRTPLYAGASAKVIMAFLSLEEKQKIIQKGLKKWTNQTIIDPQKLLTDLQKIKESGWSYSQGEFTESTIGLGVPIFNERGVILGSLTITMPEYRLTKTKFPLFKKEVIETGENIQKKINKYRPDINHNLFLYDWEF